MIGTRFVAMKSNALKQKYPSPQPLYTCKHSVRAGD